MNPTRTSGAATSKPREGLYSVAWVVEGTTGCPGGLLAAIDQIGCVGKKVCWWEPPKQFGARNSNFPVGTFISAKKLLDSWTKPATEPELNI